MATVNQPPVEQSRGKLDVAFSNGKTPSGTDFSNLIAAALNQLDDGIVKNSGSPIAIIADTGAGANQPVLEFADPSTNLKWTLSLNNSNTDGFAVEDNTSTARLFIAETNGNVGVGTTSPPARLSVVVPSASDVPPLQVTAGTGNSAATLLKLDGTGRLAVNGDLPGDSTIRLFVGAPASGDSLLQITNAVGSSETRLTTSTADMSWAASNAHNTVGLWDYKAATRTYRIVANGATGNVAIGNQVSPTARLYVATDSSTPGFLINNGSHDVLKVDASGAITGSGPLNLSGNGTSWVGGSLAVNQASAASGGHALQVAGSIQATGLTVNGPVTLSRSDIQSGSIVVAANSNENAIYLEAYAPNGTDSAGTLYLTGARATNVNVLEMRANTAQVTGNFLVEQVLKVTGTGGSFIAGPLGVGQNSAPSSGISVTGPVVASGVLNINATSGSSWVAGSLAVGKGSGAGSGLALDVNGSLNATNVLKMGAITRVEDHTVELSLVPNGGGILRICNNQGDGEVFIEALSTDGQSSASALSILGLNCNALQVQASLLVSDKEYVIDTSKSTTAVQIVSADRGFPILTYVGGDFGSEEAIWISLDGKTSSNPGVWTLHAQHGGNNIIGKARAVGVSTGFK